MTKEEILNEICDTTEFHGPDEDGNTKIIIACELNLDKLATYLSK